ncbi:unnamed protein product [Prorocentrum cordatum]|uniref:Thioredoxin-like fold domain-containing protein n=1 Tax=Prorocentrum cordatum TaxID=2364126 RepID=A0ABN9PZ04_9DINO|nr:unnamed protein product [Polarella glacialis]|mmetsp:Transcript_66789/g.178709  ORF Transcript_66789/g.178709 Transcript_66789/m.178709 type:complete len:300 (+) Transcript_66789:101-1000(+)
MLWRDALLALAGVTLAVSVTIREERAVCERKVNVQIFFEPGCKYCRQYLAGPVKKAISHESTRGCMNIDFNPLGNAFYQIPECKNASTSNVTVPSCGGAGGYDAGIRACYNKKCGPGAAAADRVENCYRGHLIFQHGFKEARFTRYFACAKHADSTKSWESYGQFVLCMERNYTTTEDETMALIQSSAQGGDMIEALVQKCAEHSRISLDEIDNCYKSNGGEEAFKLEARSIPEHSGVPWIIIDGVVQPETYDEDALLLAVQRSMESEMRPPDAPRLAAIQYREFLGVRQEERRRQITC